MNTPTEFNGMRFDSKAEAEYAALLELQVKGGHLRWWLRQIPVWLGTPQNRYRVDFLVCDPAGGLVFIDVKGMVKPADRKMLELWSVYGPEKLIFVKRRGATAFSVTEEVPRGTRS